MIKSIHLLTGAVSATINQQVEVAQKPAFPKSHTTTPTNQPLPKIQYTQKPLTTHLTNLRLSESQLPNRSLWNVSNPSARNEVPPRSRAAQCNINDSEMPSQF
jgi:hypothetical protein